MPPRTRATSCAIGLVGYSPDGMTASVALTSKPAARSRIVQWHVAWGDGQMLNGPGLPPTNLSHTYTTEGDLTLTLTVWDTRGGKAESSLAGKIVFRNSLAPVGDPADEYVYYCQGGYAGTGSVLPTNGSRSDVQTKIDAATNGDIICIPSGSYTWDQAVVWADKDILVIGAGSAATTITSSQNFIFFVHIANVARGGFRITGLHLTGSVTEAAVRVSSASIAAVATGRWRIDHNHFDMTSGYRDAVHIGRGVNYGVIDHNTFDWFGAFVIRETFALDSEDGSGDKSTWAGNFCAQQPTAFGSDQFVFVEDNTINSYRNDGSPLWVHDSSNGGGRIVFRRNAVTGGQFYNHWTRGQEIAATAMEIYNNTWVIGSAPLSTFDPQAVFRIEGGTGLFYNNYSNYNGGAPFVTLDDRRSGGFGGPVGSEADPGVTWEHCDGTHAWDGNAGDASAPGWPCLGQIGRGWTSSTSFVNLAAGTVEQPSEPFYLWNNGTQVGCANGGSCTDSIAAFTDPAAYIKKVAHAVNGEVDYVENGSTPKPGYTAHPYPHSLQSQAWP